MKNVNVQIHVLYKMLFVRLDVKIFVNFWGMIRLIVTRNVMKY